jgi:ATPase subunit of ABC transporter with duplicated ATPase domains
MVVEDVTIQAGVRDLLSNVSWRLMPGHRVGLVGANGAGKSTLLKCLAGMRTVRTWAREPWGAAPQLARCPGGDGD